MSSRHSPLPFLVPLLLWAGLASGQALDDGERHYDARAGLSRSLSVDQLRSQAQAPQSLSADVQELSALELDEITGAVRSLASERGFLSAATPGKPMTIAMDFVRRNLAALGLEASDLEGYTVSNVVYSKVTGATRIYLQQRHQGIPVYNAQLQINVNREGRIISVNNSFMAGLQRAAGSLKPVKQLPAAVGEALRFSGMKTPAPGSVGTNRVATRRHFARAHRRLADAVAGATRRGTAGVEFPDPHARQAAHVGSHRGRRHRPGVDAFRLGCRRSISRVSAAGRRARTTRRRCRRPTAARWW